MFQPNERPNPTSLPIAIAVWCVSLAIGTPANAATISLATPLTGNTTGLSHVDLTVSVDLNGAAPNLVGQELYVVFSGLTPGSFALGDVFAPFEPDGLFHLEGTCADLGCTSPDGGIDSPTTYLSAVNVVPPFQPAGPGTLFSLRFDVDPSATEWTLNLFGEEGVALLADACDQPGLDCVLDPLVIPFAIVAGGDDVAPGIARVGVAATEVGAVVVSESGTLALLGIGLCLLAARTRSLERK